MSHSVTQLNHLECFLSFKCGEEDLYDRINEQDEELLFVKNAPGNTSKLPRLALTYNLYVQHQALIIPKHYCKSD